MRTSVTAVLLLPGLVLSLGAGAVFGLQLGLLAVWAGATLGETLAFLLGRCGANTSHLPLLCCHYWLAYLDCMCRWSGLLVAVHTSREPV